MSDVLLQVEGISVNYGNIQAVVDVSLDVRRGEIVTLIGSNGAGKSTLLRTISGLHKPRTGSITLEGENLVGRQTHDIARMGVAHAPEGRRVLPGLTVEQNLQVGTSARSNQDPAAIAEDLDRIYTLFPRLLERRKQLGWSLSGGEQQMLTLGRALISRPRVLLLDEPSLGLAPKLTQEVFQAIRTINAVDNVTILLVEQNAYMALSIADRCYLLENGVIRLSGTAEEVKATDDVRHAYLGG
jgi:branched-chain amino acid transport system ATP-binding protein